MNETNSSLTYYLHIGRISDVPLRVTAALLTQILSEPAFNVLRTKEQLGYIVSCSQWLLAASTEKGIRIVVQSEKPPGYLEKRVDAFLEGMKSTLEDMSAEEFEQQKDGLEKKWSEVDKNLAEETSRFVTHIMTGQYDFLRSKPFQFDSSLSILTPRPYHRGYQCSGLEEHHERGRHPPFHVTCPSLFVHSFDTCCTHAFPKTSVTESQRCGRSGV